MRTNLPKKLTALCLCGMLTIGFVGTVSATPKPPVPNRPPIQRQLQHHPNRNAPARSAPHKPNRPEAHRPNRPVRHEPPRHTPRLSVITTIHTINAGTGWAKYSSEDCSSLCSADNHTSNGR